MPTTSDRRPPSYTTEVATPSDLEIAVTRTFAAPRALVWAAHTEPAHLRRWLLGPDGWTMTACDVDLRPGGESRMAWARADGAQGSTDGGAMEIRGVYQEVTPPERLVHTESWGGEGPETLNTTTFAESDGRTTVTLVIRYPSTEARDAALRSGMKEGVDQSYDRLDAHLGGAA